MTVTIGSEVQQWVKTRDNRTGRPLFVAVPSQSVPGLYHLVSSAGCDCRGFSYRQTCKHWRAVQAEALKVAAPTPAPSFVRDASIGGPLQPPEAARLKCLADSIWGVDGE